MTASVYIPTRGFPYCETIWRLNSEGVIYSFMAGSVSWSNTMNRCVESFLSETEADIFISIDDDTIPPEGFLERLVRPIEGGDFDIVGLPCLAATPNQIFTPNVFTWTVVGEDYQWVPRFGRGLEQVEAVGSACIAIHRKVLKKIKAPFNEELHPNGTVKLSGDLRFCEKAASQGFKIGCDFDALCEHYRTVHLSSTALAYSTALLESKDV